MSDDALMYYFPLVKAGYGSLFEVMQFSARMVLQALYYESFVKKYEAASLELSRDRR